MRYFVILFLYLILICSCKNADNTKPKSLTLTMKMHTMIARPCINYTLDIEPNGKIVFVKDCYYLEGNRKYESQLSDLQLKEITEEIEKTDFFSFANTYNSESRNCSQYSTDSPIVTLTVNFNGKQKTVEHNWGCWVNNWFGKENALQPLTDLENKIDEIVETKRWIGEGK
ncbi:MAG: DUF6438 domain-containing protein [Pyrinomonadaceae bacterium]